MILITTTTNVDAVQATPGLSSSPRSVKAIAATKPILLAALEKQDLHYGAPIFIRIFKRPAVLELWVKHKSGNFKKFKRYPICTFSGKLGPKLRQGDWQAPEGFYFVKPAQLNPWSRFHLSFNLGYPNAFDRHHGRTGDFLMVHGDCVSIGCYAMTDDAMEEIYSLAAAALENGQPYFRVHIFPFPLGDSSLDTMKQHRWYDFWRNLKNGYDYFEQHRQPPNIEVRQGRYIVDM